MAVEISIIVPVFNEAENVLPLVREVTSALQPLQRSYELVLVDDHLRTMIHDGAAEHEMERYARTLTPSIRDDGRAKVLAGSTTLEEVLRVTRED